MDHKRRRTSKKKKVKKTKKKPPMDSAAVELAAENRKKDVVASLKNKLDLPEEELLKAYEDFYVKYPKGDISEKQFIQQSKVCSDVQDVSLKFMALNLEP